MLPLDYLEQQRRQRLCLALAMTCLISMFVGSIFVWAHHMNTLKRQAKAAIETSSSALDQLNQQVISGNGGSGVPKGCESTLLLMRHCEKVGPSTVDINGDDRCSYLGYERSYFLPTLFGDTETARWPLPAFLFALTVDRHDHRNFREYETLLPLSRKANVETDLVKHHGFATDYFGLLQTGDLCGQVAVVSWKHEYIPELAATLGCGPENGCPQSYRDEEFDQVWMLKYVYHPSLPGHYIDLNDFEEEEEEEKENNNEADGGRRQLKKKKKKNQDGASGERQQWYVYGSVTQQGFDPLAFSKQSGDYPPGGKDSAGGWRDKINNDDDEL